MWVSECVCVCVVVAVCVGGEVLVEVGWVGGSWVVGVVLVVLLDV